jgi:hypothetical protein
MHENLVRRCVKTAVSGGGRRADQARRVLGGRSGSARSTLGTWPARKGIEMKWEAVSASTAGMAGAIAPPTQQAAQLAAQDFILTPWALPPWPS